MKLRNLSIEFSGALFVPIHVHWDNTSTHKFSCILHGNQEETFSKDDKYSIFIDIFRLNNTIYLSVRRNVMGDSIEIRGYYYAHKTNNIKSSFHGFVTINTVFQIFLSFSI
jgi:hypothetical protein